MVFKHRPWDFHPDAWLAHIAAEEAHSQGKFWEYAQLLFADSDSAKRADLERKAEALSLDMSRFRAALDEQRHAARVGRATEQAERLRINGTPTLFLNGRRLRGYSTVEELRQMIERELEAVAPPSGA